MSLRTPSSGQNFWGRGELRIDFWNAGAPTNAWEHPGMCTQFETNVQTESEDLENAMSGVSALYNSMITKLIWEGSIKSTEFSDRMIRAQFAGSSADLTQAGSSKVDQAPTGDPTMKKSQSCFIGFYGVTVFTLKMAPSTALVLGTDYTFDAESGEVTILESSVTFTNGSKLLWSGTVPAITATANRSIITPMANAQLICSLRYKTATDVQGTKRAMIYIPQMILMPDGSVDWLAKKFGELTYKYKVQKHPTLGYGSIVEL